MITLQNHDFIIRNDTVYDIDGRVIGYVTSASRKTTNRQFYYNGTVKSIPEMSSASITIELCFDGFLKPKNIVSKEKMEAMTVKKPKARAIKI